MPPVALIVSPILSMMPAIYAFEANRLLESRIDALQAFAICSFVIGALAMGLADGEALFLSMILWQRLGDDWQFKQ